MLSERDTVLYTAIHDCEEGPAPVGGRYSQEEEANGSDYISYKLYPNPNTGSFNVWLEMDDESKAEMRVWSISGREVYRTKLNGGTSTVDIRVAEGLYLYMITVNNKVEWTGKVSILSY
jgi:hypothetical protein